LEWDRSKFDEFLVSRGLFEEKYIVKIRDPFEDKEVSKTIEESAEDMSLAPHLFVIISEKISVPLKKVFTKHKATIEEFNTLEKNEEFNVFSITEALLQRDSKKLWTLYRKALDSGIAPEQIHGVLWWQMKSVVIAMKSKNENEAGMKPFVFSKSKRALTKFSKEEVENLLSKLLSIYHNSRIGKINMEYGLESFVLGI